MTAENELTVLQADNLSISFADEQQWHRVVNKVSFRVERGQVLGIVGESGSGKSVTSLAVMRLLPGKGCRIDEGNIIFTPNNKQALHLLRQSEKQMSRIRGGRIAMIFQEPMTSLNPVMRCGRQITESLHQHGGYSGKQAKEKVLELFSEVKLPNPERVFRAYPHQLSGGQKQRVMIAMALAGNPEVLIADEPTTALDVTVQKTILQLLKSLQQKYRMSLIFISHDLGVVSEIADSVIVMKAGEIVEQGSTKDIFNHPQHPYTQGLLACRPPLDSRPVVLPVVSAFTGGRSPDVELISNVGRSRTHKTLYSQPPLLRVENLSVEYKSQTGFFSRKKATAFKAVNQVNLEVYKGETLGLVGESGCGKTTLGRAILQLTPVSAGHIWFDGIEVNALSTNEMKNMRKRFQIIFQDPYSSLNPRITAGESILEPLIIHKMGSNSLMRRNKMLELFEQVGLQPDHHQRYPHQFSGGQRQRICIARALAVNPEFIICDESVSALDVSVQAQVLNLLNELKRSLNFTYIFISHDLSVVRYMSDRIAVMKSGEIIESGEADSLFNHPSQPYTHQLIEAIPGRGLNQIPPALRPD
ncbi:MAG: ABC transporter ATP-binding protein [Lentimicrobiaceae bacterium]|nr:ABC transporter ATP-binding protein [Lentimicrobiaceae bacterium]